MIGSRTRWKRNEPRLRPRAGARILVLGRLLAALALVTPAAKAAVVQPVFHSSFQAATSAAAADRSLVLLVFGAEWCGPCKMLKSQTLSSPDFLRQDAPLHVAEVDVDADAAMAANFDVEAVPTLVLLTADGKIIARQTGFLAVGDLLDWLRKGRERAAAGQWEGVAPGAEVDGFLKKAAAGDLGTNDLQRLMGLLGDPDPANREQAAKILAGQRERVVPQLIEAVADPYLGTRIAAADLLRRMDPDVAPIDPWQSPLELSNRVATLRKWWAATGRLPDAPTMRAPAALPESSIQAELTQLRGTDPVQRTAAMTALVGGGADSLPAVRQAIRRAERDGDARTLGLLEDVRWTLLIPDAVEQQQAGLRNALARGKSSERQAAAERLGRSGRAALGALAELAADPDALVAEAAVRALSNIGGNDTVPALAALLNSPDSNLRMTAAQALGQTKSTAAVKPLLAAMGDTDEIVACTALSALEQIESRDYYYSSSPRTFSEDIVSRLKRCLEDPRWRVRAAAAEVVGKLEIGSLAEAVKKLLDDPDGFVVKNALTALGKLHAAPAPDRLAALCRRLPSLQGDAVVMMLQSDSDDVAKTVTELFNSGTTDTRLAIVKALAQNATGDDSRADTKWKPLLSQALAAAEPRLRRAAVEMLGQSSPKLAAELVGPRLADDDEATRQAAAEVVLTVLNQEGIDRSQPPEFSRGSKTNAPLVTAAQMIAWHAAMLQHPAGPQTTWELAAAIYATGDGKADLPLLLDAMSRRAMVSDVDRRKQETERVAMGLVLGRLPWPEGRPLLDKLSGMPVWFAMAASQRGRARPEVAAYLLDPARFKAAVEPLSGPELSATLELLAGYTYDSAGRGAWSLWSDAADTEAVAMALVQSTNAAWRAAAVFSLGLRDDAKQNEGIFENAAADANPWVRASAVRAIARNTPERATRELRLGPLLADTNLAVATAAAVALLQPETRQAAGLENELNYFEFDDVRGGRSEFRNQDNDRPLSVIAAQPPFLEAARHWLTVTNGEAASPLALLLAQYGDFSGLDQLLAKPLSPDTETIGNGPDVLLAGIALSRDIKYLPALKQMASTRREEGELRKVLQGLNGMSGPEARRLRSEINKKIRNTGD